MKLIKLFLLSSLLLLLSSVGYLWIHRIVAGTSPMTHSQRGRITRDVWSWRRWRNGINFVFGNSVISEFISCFLLEAWNQTRHLNQFCGQNGIGREIKTEKKKYVSMNSIGWLVFTCMHNFGLKLIFNNLFNFSVCLKLAYKSGIVRCDLWVTVWIGAGRLPVALHIKTCCYSPGNSMN